MSNVYVIASNSVSDGNYDFEKVGYVDSFPNLFLDEFRFVDGTGSTVIPSAGTVSVQVSSDGTFWRELNDGSFTASTDTSSGSYVPPSGLAAITKLRIVLSGVTGASGFKANFVRG